jgi:hypothetical protein
LTVTASNISLPYDQSIPPFTGTIEGVTNGDNITAAYSCAATNGSPVGMYPIVPSLVDPQDRQTNYNVTLLNATLTITEVTPVVAWTNPASIVYGAPLTTNQLNATANVPGSFTYLQTNGTVLDAGTNELTAVFTPADTVDYSIVIQNVSLVVTPAPLTVTASNVSQPYGLSQGIPPFTGTIEGVTNGDNITVTYSCSATNGSPAGIYPIVPSLVDPQDRQTNYNVSLINGTLIITGAPVLSWAPAPITYGAALGSNQLDATTSVPGSFVYIPTNGTVLNAGTNTLSVVFTPNDMADFSVVAGSANLIVSPAPLIVTASNASRPYGLTNPPFTGTMTGVTNGDNITATYSCSATNGSPAGIYPIVPSLVDPQDRQTNYNVTLVSGALTVISQPIIQTATQSGSSFIFTLTAAPNQTYQIQYTTNLTQPWTAVGSTIVPTNATTTISELIGSNNQQFYRVVQLP